VKPTIHIEGDATVIDCLDMRPPRRVRPDWICGNERCNEVNYHEIKYCLKCGFRRGERRST